MCRQETYTLQTPSFPTSLSFGCLCGLAQLVHQLLNRMFRSSWLPSTQFISRAWKIVLLKLLEKEQVKNQLQSGKTRQNTNSLSREDLRGSFQESLSKLESQESKGYIMSREYLEHDVVTIISKSTLKD